MLTLKAKCVAKNNNVTAANIRFMVKPETVQTQQGAGMQSKKSIILQTDDLDFADTIKIGKEYPITIGDPE